jgi:hypothetical protein
MLSGEIVGVTRANNPRRCRQVRLFGLPDQRERSAQAKLSCGVERGGSLSRAAIRSTPWRRWAASPLDTLPHQDETINRVEKLG